MSTRSRIILLPLMAFLVTTLLFSVASRAFAHERKFLTIKDKPYLVVVGSVNEPVYGGDKSGVEFFA